LRREQVRALPADLRGQARRTELGLQRRRQRLAVEAHAEALAVQRFDHACALPAPAVPVSGLCRQASTAPRARASAELASPPCRPPAVSAIQPTALGPTIWPNANTIVNALMPPAHSAAGRLWRTSAVVDATSDRNTLPNSSPDAKTATGCALSTGNTVASASRPLSSASASPPRQRCSTPAHSHDEATTPRPSST